MYLGPGLRNCVFIAGVVEDNFLISIKIVKIFPGKQLFHKVRKSTNYSLETFGELINNASIIPDIFLDCVFIKKV